MSEIKEFKTESKRLLELMINSIYTNREIFLRELISNASDALDKFHYLSLTDQKLEKRDYEIFLEINKKARTLTITDNGIGMTYEELENGLGTIARSGSAEFIKNLKNKSDQETIDIIGQFGVGFYSAFMVASKVEVRTKSPYSDKAYLFKSAGVDTYEVEEVEGLKEGTAVTVFFRKSTKENDFDEFLEEYTIKRLIKKYSDYVRYPIKMNVKKSVPKKDKEGKDIAGKYEDVWEIETLNSMIPLWKKRKKDVTDEELAEFYKQKFYDYQDPQVNIFFNVEGALNYTALIFIPKKAPYNLYSEKYEKGLQLYSKGVFVMEKCKELVPDYLRFVKGLVDSSDLSLNISREILQKNKDLENIAKNVEKKILSKLESMLKNDRDKYIEFFKSFGVNLKFGVYDQFGEKKDLLKDLLLYRSVNQDNYITLKEYVETMPKAQEYIYYASGKTKEQVLALPQMDLIKKQGFDVLILDEEIDEFAIQMLQEYDKKKFKSINQGDLDLLSKDEEKKIAELSEDKKSMLEKIKEILKDEVSDVILSKRLTDSPVCLVSAEGLSFEMEKVIANMPHEEKPKATKILEINPNHPLFKALENLYNDNNDLLNDYASLLYSQALLIEGFTLKDPVAFSKQMSDLMIKVAKY
ncbi:MAG TPA: molecular chaperone HtpG [Bacilli bacterium]|nr:MAG: Chaperone protein HtpG [Tenericutes bacterium ADurb.BinA124]HNZ50314.1 molecular chaperone HtpG [Bacilli bacterium]HPX84527.1 molecular chaperone HtpG [Bacilli bacterium]HQC74367.1 molecular chaperone HtpG [Bacilli bacterium]